MSPRKHAAASLGLFFVYGATSWLSTWLSRLPEPFVNCWLSGGLLVGALMRSPSAAWPSLAGAALVADLAVHLLNGAPPAVSIGLAGSSLLQGLIGAWLMRRMAGSTPTLGRHDDVTRILLALIASSAAAGLAGSVTIVLAYPVPFGGALLTCSFSDFVGALIVLPITLTFLKDERSPPLARASTSRIVECACLIAGTLAVAEYTFSAAPEAVRLPAFLFPFLIWSAVRFGWRGQSLIMGIVFLSSMAHAKLGHGFLVSDRFTPELGNVRLQALYALVATSMLLLGAGMYESRRNARELAASEARLRAFIDGIREYAFFMLDSSGKILMWNTGAERTMGYVAEEIVGKDYASLFPATAAADGEPARELEQAARAGATFREGWRARKDGSYYWSKTLLTVVPGPSGGPHCFAAVCRDLTEMRRADTARQELEAKLAHSQKMDAIGQLAGGMAHDFNNFLTVINGNASLLRSKLTPEHPMRRQLDAIHQTGTKAAAVVRQLMLFSRKTALTNEVVDLNVVLDEAEPLCRSAVGEPIALTVSRCAGACYVTGDPVQLQQMILNLVLNARDAMPSGGKLSISTRVVDDRALLEVIDTGCGMPEEVRARIFEPFFTTKPAGKGTGLGLSIVHGIVKRGDGRIEVRSSPGRGTTFQVALPLASKPAKPRSETNVGVVPGGREAILLVEDEPGVREIVREFLAELGYEVVVAVNGAEALRRFEALSGRIDLLLTDVVMPEMNGRELSEVLWKKVPGLKILFMSGYHDDDILRNGIQTGTIHFIGKPFAPEDLAIKVREVLDQERAAA